MRSNNGIVIPKSTVNSTVLEHVEQSSTTIKYKLDKGDYEKLNDFLDIDWDQLLDPSILTVDEMWEKFKLTVLDGMSKYIPKNDRQRKIKKNFQPFSAELRHLIHRKHHLWNHWMSSRLESVHREYKVIRNKVRRETVKLLQREQQRISAKCKKNPKLFWQYVNKKTNLIQRWVL